GDDGAGQRRRGQPALQFLDRLEQLVRQGNGLQGLAASHLEEADGRSWPPGRGKAAHPDLPDWHDEDCLPLLRRERLPERGREGDLEVLAVVQQVLYLLGHLEEARSEERRVGKE